MLPARARLRSSDDFRTCVRKGVRVGRGTLVLHAHLDAHSDAAGDTGSPRVGFVVSKAVGGAVVRNRVKRRLRHLSAAQLASTPSRATVVVRALPAAATAGDELARDLATAWAQALAKAMR